MTEYDRGCAADWADELAAKIIKADADPSSIEIAAHLRRQRELGRAAGLAEAVKVAEAYAAGYSAQIKRLQASLPSRGGPERTAILDDIAHDSGLLETAVEIAKSLRALSTSPGEHVLVPREPSDAMIEAALATGVFDTDHSGSDADAVTKAYRAMLSAEKP